MRKQLHLNEWPRHPPNYSALNERLTSEREFNLTLFISQRILGAKALSSSPSSAHSAELDVWLYLSSLSFSI